MSFHDDSHILSRLGILQSKDECPRKAHHSPSNTGMKVSSDQNRFVEVNIDGDISSRSDSDDEEPIFDKNSLLSPPSRNSRVYRRKPESYKCIYVTLLLTYLALGTGWSIPLVNEREAIDILSSFASVYSCGLLFGTFTGKTLCRKLNIAFILFLCTVLLCSIFWTMSDFPEVLDVRVSVFSIGYCSGNVLYGGLALWFIHWRGYNRKALLLYVLMAFGTFLAVFLHNRPVSDAGGHNTEDSSVSLHKRQANGSFLSNETFPIVASLNESTLTKPKKPQVVQGSQVIETKSEQNEQMRKAVNLNKTLVSSTTAPVDYINGSAPSNSVDKKNDSVIDHTTTSDTVATKPILRLDTTTVSGSSPVETESVASVFKSERKAIRRTGSVLTSIVLATYLVAFLTCCISCSAKGGAKFVKLFDPSVAGLTRGCRLRLASVQTTAALIEGLVDMGVVTLSAEVDNSSLLVLHFAVIGLSRLVALICGPCAYSLTGCCLALLCSLLGSILVLVTSLDPHFGFCLLSASSGVFGLLLFLYLEVRIRPRAGTQLDYYLFPTAVGRFLAALLCVALRLSSSEQIVTVVLLLVVPLMVLLLLLVKSVGKAVRLKEVMEYSTSPVLEASGEYVSLIERDIRCASSEEDDDDHSFASREI